MLGVLVAAKLNAPAGAGGLAPAGVGAAGVPPKLGAAPGVGAADDEGFVAGANPGVVASPKANPPAAGAAADGAGAPPPPDDTGAAALPRNSFGGLTAVVVQAMGGGLQGPKVCLSQVPGKAAAAIDTQIDDGQGATGKMRATLGSAGANTNPNAAVLAAPYSEDDYYTICAGM